MSLISFPDFFLNKIGIDFDGLEAYAIKNIISIPYLSFPAPGML
jgi:hypothetical protein